jgi:hypothetical protein
MRRVFLFNVIMSTGRTSNGPDLVLIANIQTSLMIALAGCFLQWHPNQNWNRPTDVGTFKDGYVHNAPFPQVPQIQSASPMTSPMLTASTTGIPLPGYLHVPYWIPTLPTQGGTLRFGLRLLLLPFPPIAIKS